MVTWVKNEYSASGEKAAGWLTDVWQYFWQAFDSKDWEDMTTTNWEDLGG